MEALTVTEPTPIETLFQHRGSIAHDFPFGERGVHVSHITEEGTSSNKGGDAYWCTTCPSWSLVKVTWFAIRHGWSEWPDPTTAVESPLHVGHLTMPGTGVGDPAVTL